MRIFIYTIMLECLHLVINNIQVLMPYNELLMAKELVPFGLTTCGAIPTSITDCLTALLIPLEFITVPTLKMLE